MIFNTSIDFSQIDHIILVQKPIDLRKGIDGYVSYVQGCLRLKPNDNSIFLFTNRQKNKLKAIIFRKNGWWLHYWRLIESSFQWPTSSNSSDFLQLSLDQVSLLFSGRAVIPPISFDPNLDSNLPQLF